MNEKIVEKWLPKKIQAAIEHYSKCLVKHCLHSNDSIAYALIASKTLRLHLPCGGKPYSVSKTRIELRKFLSGIINHERFPCNHAFSYKTLYEVRLR